MPSIKDVAQRAGVSLGTASNAINKPEMVSPERRARVLAAIDELGFVPNSAAWHQRLNRRPVIGFLSPNVANPFFAEVAKGIEDAAFNAGYATHFCDIGIDGKREAEHIRVLQADKVSAVIATTLTESTEALQRLQAQGIAVVLLGRVPRTQSVCSVAVDDAVGGQEAARHLVSLGHKQILWIATGDNVPRRPIRQIAFTQQLNELRREDRRIRLELIEADNSTAAAGDAAVSRALMGDFKYTAIACTNDLVALGAMRALARVGIRIPEDVSVIGYDDIEYASMAMVPLTTIRQPMRELGRATVEQAIRDVKEGRRHAHHHVTFTPRLIQRASTAPVG